MTTLTQFLGKIHHPQMSYESQSKIDLKRIGEIGWGVSTFLLFLALGPFSAIAAVCGVMSLSKNVQHREPEAI